MKRVIFFLAICVCASVATGQGPSKSPFAESSTINHISKFKELLSKQTMEETKIKVRSRITGFNFQTGVGEWADIKRFQIKDGKFYKKGFSKLRIETGIPFAPMEIGKYVILISRKDKSKDRVIRVTVTASTYELELYKMKAKSKVTKVNHRTSIDQLKSSEIPDFQKSKFGQVPWNEKLDFARVIQVDLTKYFQNEVSIKLRTFYQSEKEAPVYQTFNSACEEVKSVKMIIPSKGIYWLEVIGETGTYVYRLIASRTAGLNAELFISK